MACEPGQAEPRTPGFHRRDRRRNRHDAPLWPLPARSAPGIRCAVGTLEDHNSRCTLRVGQIAAPCVFNGPMDGPSFRAYVGQFVVQILRRGDIVVMDNLPSHKVAGIRQAIEAAGAKLRYLPAYSPDFNPIEQFFAKLKALLRKTAARTVEALITAIAEALNNVSPQECENYLANQGYRRQS